LENECAAIAIEIRLVIGKVETMGARNNSGGRLASGIGSQLECFNHAASFVLSAHRQKNFGGRNCQTALKNYNLYSVYTIDRDGPSREEWIRKQESIQ